MFPNEEQSQTLISRFENGLLQGKPDFFDVEEFEELSDHYFETGNTQVALRVLDLASDQHPYSSVFHLKKAQFLAALDNMEEAEVELSLAEKIDPYSTDLLVARGMVFSRQGLHSQALKCFKKAADREDCSEDIYLLMAQEYQNLGNYEMAIKNLKELLIYDPDDEVALYQVSLCYDLLGQTEKGIEFLNAFIDRNPYAEVAWHQLAISYSKTGNNEKALWAIGYALVIDDFFTAAYLEKARILERMARYADAIQT